MSEQGWRDFLAAAEVGDWVVLHGGATAVFRMPFLGDAARLADAIARVPGIDRSGVLTTPTGLRQQSGRVCRIGAGPFVARVSGPRGAGSPVHRR